MKQITSYYNYTKIKDWSDEELESLFTDTKKWKEIGKTCPYCKHDLSLIVDDSSFMSTNYYLMCTYCHKEHLIMYLA